MGWTNEQLAAIESRDENLLLSAAAGSGKTTVLVERVLRLIREGADTFIELGPGKTLRGLIKKIDPDVRSYGAADMDGLQAVLEEVAHG